MSLWTLYGAALNAGLILTLRNLPRNASLELAAVSHVEVVFLFHLACESDIARHRLEWPKVGIFAQRGENQPNRIGVAICRLCR